MIALDIRVDGDGAWPDLALRERIRADVYGIAALAKGMDSGRSSVMIRVDLPDGRVVMAETSMRLFLNAANIFRVKYGAELEGEA